MSGYGTKTGGFMKIAFFALAGLFSVFLILAITASFAAEQFQPAGLLFGLIMAGAMLALASFSGRFSKRTVALACVLICVLPRLLLVLCTMMEMGYDFSRYYDTALAMAYGAPIPDQAYQAMFPHILGYPAALSAVFRIFGDSLGAAQGFNIFLDAISCTLLFRIGSKRFGDMGGALAAALYAVNPNAIMHMPVSCGEPLYMALMLASIALFERLAGQSEEGWLRRLPGWLLLGLATGLFNAVRPLGPVLIIAFCACYLVFGKRRFLKKLLPIALLCASYLASCAVYFAWAEHALERPVARGAAGWNLYLGMNAGTGGRWTAGDNAIVVEKLGKGESAPDIQADLIRLAGERAGDNFKSGKIWGLIITKLKHMWGRDNSMLYWLNELEDKRIPPAGGDFTLDMGYWSGTLDIFCGAYWWGLLLLCLPSAYFLFRRGSPVNIVPTCIVILIGILLVFLALESNARYHFPADALLAVIAGWGCGEVSDRFGGRDAAVAPARKPVHRKTV